MRIQNPKQDDCEILLYYNKNKTIIMKTEHLTYEWEISPNNIVEIDYTYSQESGDYLQPPYEEIEIDRMTLNGDDVTDRLHDTFEYEIIEEITNQTL
tara:strand:- start:3379 stop:3669 length:291 start_codon:yes stop_codon:yes gene_type:complete